MPSLTQRLLLVPVYTSDRFTQLCVSTCLWGVLLFEFVCVCLCMFVCKTRASCVHVLSTCDASTFTAHLQGGGLATPRGHAPMQRQMSKNDGAQVKFLRKDRRELRATATHAVLAPWQHQASLPNAPETQLRPNVPP